MGGIKVPTLVRWSPKGSITSEFLVDICATLDHLKVFNRDDGAKPFILLDGHQSRIELPFLEYVNNPAHPWCACIGVPYGTYLWQVGDSEEQNGTFNMESTKAKMRIVAKKERMSLPPVIEPYEIIPIINSAWPTSFGRVKTNQNAISERGWYPWNRNLLLHNKIRAAMTNEEKEKEPSRKILIPTHRNERYVDLSKNTPTFDKKFYPTVDANTTKNLRLNFSQGTALRCLERIVQSNDTMEARCRIKAAQDKGKTLHEELEDARSCTAGVIVKARHHRLGLTVKDFVKEGRQKKKEEARAAEEKLRAYQSNNRQKLEEVLMKNKPPHTWNIAEFTAVLRVLKTKDDGPMPKKKTELFALFERLKHRSVELLNYGAAFFDNNDAG